MGLLSQQYGKVLQLSAGSTLCTPTIKVTDQYAICFTHSNPRLTSGSSYIIIPNGLYVSGGTTYIQGHFNARCTIKNDSATTLKICGGCDSDKCTVLCGKTFSCTCVQTPSVCATSCLRSSGNTYSDNYLVDAGNQCGLKFWNGSSCYTINMSATTSGQAGEIWSQGDYNMYFRMKGTDGAGTSCQRGFVWQEDDGAGNTQNLAHLNHQGLRFASTSCGFICSCTGCIKYPIYEARYSNGNTNYRGFFCWNKLQLGNNGPNQIIAGDEGGGGRFEFYVNNCADGTANPNGTLAMVMCQGGGVYGCVCLQSPRICGTSCLRGATVCATGQARVCTICTIGSACNTIAGQLAVNDLCSTTGMSRTFPTWSIMGTRYLPQVSASANLPVGWHTIFVNTGSRAGGRFVLRDTTGSRHQYVVFYATHSYGSGNSINVLSYSRYSGQPMQCIRIKDGSTYDGAALQVYVCDACNNLVAYEAGDNIHSSGWYFLNSWCCDACVPYSYSCFNACWPAGCYCTGASVNLHCIQDGGQILTGTLMAPYIRSTGSLCGHEICTQGWFRNSNSGNGLYNQVNGVYWYSNSCTNMTVQAGCANNIGITGYACSANRGCIHWNCDNQIHIYDSGGNARILVNSSNDIRLCNTTCVYGNLNVTSQIKGGRICSTATGTCAIVSAGGICVTSDWYRITGNNGLYFSSHTAGIHGGGTGVVCAYNNGSFCSNATSGWGLRSAGCILAVSCMKANCNVCAGCNLVSGNAVYVGEWVRFNSATRGMYWDTNCKLHLYPGLSNTPYLHLRSCHSNTALVITTSGNTTARGYFYGNSSNNIGILDSDGDWAIRHLRDNCTEFRVNNGVKATIFSSCFCSNNIICAATCLRAPTVCATGCVTAPTVYSNGANMTSMAQGGCFWRQFMVCGDADTFYPVCYFRGNTFGYKRYSINRSYNSTAPNTWYTSTHKGGLNYTWEQTSDTQWGGNDRSFRVNQVRETYTTVIGGHVHTVSGGVILLRGGGALYCFASDSMCTSCVCVYDGTGGTDAQGMTHSTCTYFCPGNCACVLALTCANAQSCRNSTICNTSAYPLQMHGVGNASATTGCFCVVRSAGHVCAANSVCGPNIIGGTCAQAPYVLATNCVHACCGITFAHSNWSGEKTKIQAHSCHLYFQNYNTGAFIFRNCGTCTIASINQSGCLTAAECVVTPVVRATNCFYACCGIDFVHSNWTGEKTKIQAHSNHLYFQNGTAGGCFFFRNSAGTNMVHINCNGCLYLSNCLNSNTICSRGGITGCCYVRSPNYIQTGSIFYPWAYSYNCVRHAVGNCTCNGWICPLLICRGGSVVINGGSLNTTLDAALFICQTTNNDWGQIICKHAGTSDDYGLDIRVGASSTAAMYARFNNIVKFRLQYNCLCHSAMISSPVVCGSTCVRGGVVCATTGFYGDGSNLTNVPGGNPDHYCAENDRIRIGRCNMPSVSTTQNYSLGSCIMTCVQSATSRNNITIGHDIANYTTAASNGICYNSLIGAMMARKACCNFINNIVIGYQAGYNMGSSSVTGAQQNIIIGSYAGSNYSGTFTGCENAFIGTGSGYSMSTGCKNSGIGRQAGKCVTTGSCNVFLGFCSGCGHTTGTGYSYVGSRLGCCVILCGNTSVCGSLSKTSGCFKIAHPNPAKRDSYDLVHSFVESPTEGDNIYRYTTETTSCRSVIELPDYYSYLNKNDQVWVSANKHFGVGYGEVTEDQKCLVVCSCCDGIYNVLLIGTRKDNDAVRNWNGPEIKLKHPDRDIVDR